MSGVASLMLAVMEEGGRLTSGPDRGPDADELAHGNAAGGNAGRSCRAGLTPQYLRLRL